MFSSCPQGKVALPLRASEGWHVAGFVVPLTMLIFNVEHQIPLPPCIIVSILWASHLLCEAHRLALQDSGFLLLGFSGWPLVISSQ